MEPLARDSHIPTREVVDWKAVIGGDHDGAEALVRAAVRQGLSPLAASRRGKTLLHAAAISSNLALARLAVEFGVPVDARVLVYRYRPGKASNGWTALMYAVRTGHYGFVRYLLEQGATAVPSAQGETPLELAIRRRLEPIFWVLIEFGLCEPGPSTLENPSPGLRDKASRKNILEAREGRAPEDLCSQTAWNGREAGLIGLVESGLRQQFYIPRNGAAMLGEKGRVFCERCTIGMADPDWTVREVWKEKERRLLQWKRRADAFDYGFMPRCGICRLALVELPVWFKPDETAHGTILSSLTPAFELTQSYAYEEDFLHLLALREGLPGQDHLGSQRALLLPSYWFLRCLKGHTSCSLADSSHGFEQPLLPKRVIAVGDEQGLVSPPRVLETTAGQRASYCTLSYRWSEHAVIMRASTAAEFHRALPVATLPSTIQHAMALARRLGFQYIWIDALCIMQDSEEDWETQAASMDAIYSNSTLTIAAIDAHDGTESPGFLVPRQPLAEYEKFRPNGMLDGRGWTLQEQVLSRRVLSFSRSCIYWNCRRWNCSEAWPAGILAESEAAWRGNPHEQSVHRPTKWTRTPELQAWAAEPEKEDAQDLWRQLVENYTLRSLTFPKDRLIAIKGIAQFFARVAGGEIAAGVWSTDDLLWIPRTVRKGKLARRIPSWSWGAVEGAVSWYGEPDTHLASVTFLGIWARDLGGGNFEGEVKLTGTLIPIVVTRRKVTFVPWSRNEENGNSNLKRYEPGGWPIQESHRKMKHDYDFLCDEEESDDFQGFALHMGGYGLCLLLTVDGKYRRVGLCKWGGDLARVLASNFGMRSGDSWPGKLEELTTVTIV